MVDKDDLEGMGMVDSNGGGSLSPRLVELETRPFPLDSCTPVLYTVSSYVGQSRENDNIREDTGPL